MIFIIHFYLCENEKKLSDCKNSLKKNNFKNDIFILDDSFKNFLTAIKSFSNIIRIMLL